MSISSALLTGVSGLAANSDRVGDISSNIANANTVGYRRSFTSFVTEVAGEQQAGVSAVSRSDITRSGTMQATGRLQDYAIAGDGFFVVSRRVDDEVAANYFLTRAGSFQPDANGNLKNSAGFYLSGFPVDALGNTGVIDRTGTGSLQTVNISEFQIAGTPSTNIDISANLPAQATGVVPPGAPFIATHRFVDPLGGTGDLRVTWQPSATAHEWTMNISDSDGNNYGDATIVFNDSGPAAGSPASFTSAGLPIDPATGAVTLSIPNGGTPQNLVLNFGAPGEFVGLTQFAGDFTPPTFTDNGSATGSLVRAEMGQSGVLFGLFDNGQRRALFEVPVADVPAANQLRAIAGNAYAPTIDSGPVRLSKAGTEGAGTIEAGVVESSNVDIAQELTDLIQTQRAYSSNAKIVTTADEMLEETLRIKR